MVRSALSIVVAVLVVGVVGPAEAEADTVQIGLRATGPGSVSANPPGLLRGCTGPYCTFSYERGTTVTLIAAAADSGASLARWTGACAGQGPICTLLLDGAKLTTARFSPVQLYVQPAHGGGTIVSSPGVRCGPACRSYPYGTAVTLTAQPRSGFMFARWSGWCAPLSSTAGCSGTLLETVQTGPRFTCAQSGDECTGQVVQPLETRVPMRIRVAGTGSLSINGSGCSRNPCDRELTRGKPAVFRAYPKSGSSFVGWQGACQRQGPRCLFTVFRKSNGSAPYVTAVFAR